MATDTSTGEYTDTISINLSNVMSSSMSANGLTYQDLYSIGPSTGGYTYTTNTTAQPWAAISTNGADNTLSVRGDADFNGDVRVKGRSLAEFMQQVEQRLNMLQPNPELEQEWDELRELGERYRELERQCKEKAQMWNTLKK
jgi:hypothetical protein